MLKCHGWWIEGEQLLENTSKAEIADGEIETFSQVDRSTQRWNQFGEVQFADNVKQLQVKVVQVDEGLHLNFMRQWIGDRRRCFRCLECESKEFALGDLVLRLRLMLVEQLLAQWKDRTVTVGEPVHGRSRRARVILDEHTYVAKKIVG
jgi:hypothetical protein